tara:strand:+ start:144 stop:338 length:195 start_codon:yes stop_codon:yes gene_type:complete
MLESDERWPKVVALRLRTGAPHYHITDQPPVAVADRFKPDQIIHHPNPQAVGSALFFLLAPFLL